MFGIAIKKDYEIGKKHGEPFVYRIYDEEHIFPMYTLNLKAAVRASFFSFCRAIKRRLRQSWNKLFSRKLSARHKHNRYSGDNGQ